jgi:hypothetical protein
MRAGADDASHQRCDQGSIASWPYPTDQQTCWGVLALLCGLPRYLQRGSREHLGA